MNNLLIEDLENIAITKTDLGEVTNGELCCPVYCMQKN